MKTVAKIIITKAKALPKIKKIKRKIKTIIKIKQKQKQ